MAGKYDAVATRALATIARKGSPVTFGATTGGTYNPLTDTWSGGTASAITGQAVQIEGDPDRFAALNLVLVNPVTLLVAAKDLDVAPEPGMTFTWASKVYTIKDVDPTAPDGVAVLYTVTGST